MTERTPNTGLAALLAATGWTQTQLAGAVNRVAREAGLPGGCDKHNVSKWLGGTVPRRSVRPLVLEALARRLGRPVTYAEAGWPPPVTGSGPAASDAEDTVEGLVSTGRADMDPARRTVLAASLYSAALPVPLFRDLAEQTDSVATGRTTRIGPGEVATVRTMTERIAGILDELGGAHARPMAAAFLVNTVGPWLRASASGPVRRSMLAAAADLVYLTGWMAMYERDHGLGQRYYLRALELAGTAEDHVTYCRTLRGMALQAANLKHGRRALELADSAAEAAPAGGPRLQAFLAGQQAHGAALVGDRRQAFARLRETEAALSRADDHRDHLGGYDLAAYHFHVSSVTYALGDVPASVRAMQDSNRVRPPVERQGRAHATGLLAQRQMEMGHLDAACETWGRFLDDYEGLSSSRADEHFEVLTRRLRSHHVPAARALRERVADVALRKATV
ncbi:hypothetical protein [Streptomyces lichenis]|uniref:Regulatory protein n=1 Tax=Streptomyces lichenis TaxID=2306967 RepID=A0ABT0IFW3_9ACTN|nr:hypothetical protein [Streptomyces lichenis]MCK8680209.1 hypothetical protein [Streptomyces lichenis]